MFKRHWWMFFVMIPLGSLAGLLLAAVITYMMPKKYESEAVIEVMPRRQPLVMELSGPQAPPRPATEVEILKSHKALEQVAANLDLLNRWNSDKETTISILKGIVETRSINGTDLISIRVRHTNRIDARDIAGELIAVHKTNRAETDARESEQHIQEINSMIRDQEDKVEERRKILRTIMRAKGIKYQKLEGDSPADVLQEERFAQQQIQQLEMEQMQLESQISGLLKHEGDHLMVYAAGLDLPDNLIHTMYPKYLETKHSLESMKINGLGEKHPSVLVVIELIKTIESQLDEGLVILRRNLEVELGHAKSRLRNYGVLNMRHDYQDYVDAKRGFETEHELLQQMKLKLTGENISRKMLSDSVRIHREPVIAQVPISPKVTLNLMLGTGAGFLFSPLMAMPLMWLLNRRRPAQTAA